MSVLPFFDDRTHGPDYEYLRGHAREYIEDMWVRFQSLCGDKPADFLNQSRLCPLERVWEMYLACFLLDHGLNLARPAARGLPDIMCTIGDRVVWVEAVLGNFGDAVRTPTEHTMRSPPLDPHRALAWLAQLNRLPENEITPLDATELTSEVTHLEIAPEGRIERYARWLTDKDRQRARRVNAGRIAPDDPYVVAINGHKLPHGDIQLGGRPDVVRAVLERGAIGRGISAVLFFPFLPPWVSSAMDELCHVVHNPSAAVKLEASTFSFGTQHR